MPSDERTVGGESMAGVDTLAASASKRVEQRSLVQGDLVGRYVVLGRLGAGAMGVVHLAYDPELDRRVALKLLHPRPELSGGSEGAERTRLLREAQAMAKLAHPSVVTVHDVGEHEGRVFLAMEFVEGCTLKVWLARRSRPWREVVEVLARAGRGLAAAHRAGLVHRDFKPDNVMVALADDRVERTVVMDFGLARPDQDPSEPMPERVEWSAPKIRALAQELTADGAVVGTPAYMPVEQLAGQRADARADQFAFAVTLYEALYRRRPFVAKDLGGLAFAIVEGKIEPPPADTWVPRWIHRVIERALRPEPDDRYASMDDLLAALERSPGRRLRVWVASALVVAIAAGSWGLVQLTDQRARADCRRHGQAIAAVWNDDAASAVAGAFAELGAPWADTAWQRDARHLDAYAAAWSNARESVCLDARVLGTVTPEIEDAAVRCLEERLDQTAALLEQLREPDLTIASSSLASIAALAPVDPCTDEAWVGRWYVADEVAEADAARLRRERQRVVVLKALSRAEEARARAQVLREEAEALGLHAIALELQLDGADAAIDLPDYAAAERETWAAYLTAVALGRDDIALRALTGHTYIAGYLLARPADGTRSAELAFALIDRLSLRGHNEEALLYGSLGPVHMLAGRIAEARRVLELVVEIRRDVLGEDHPRVTLSLGPLATVLSAQGAQDEALAAHVRALEATRETFGPEHPSVIGTLNNIAGLYARYGKYAEAESYAEQALALYRSAGTDVAVLASVLLNYGTLERNTGRTQAALAHYRGALDIYRKAAPGSAHLGDVLTNIGIVYSDLNDDRSALPHHREAQEVFEAAFGREHPRTIAALLNVGTALVKTDRAAAREAFQQALDAARRTESGEEVAGVALTNLAVLAAEAGDHEEARRFAEESLRLKEKALGPDHPRVAIALLALAKQLRALGEHEHVEAHLERALALLVANGMPSDRGDVRFELAQVLAERDPARALALAKEARADYETTGPAARQRAAMVGRWLAEHPG